MNEMQIQIPTPVTLYEDNQGCIALTENPSHHKRTKHVDVNYHVIRDYVADGTVEVKYLRHVRYEGSGQLSVKGKY